VSEVEGIFDGEALGHPHLLKLDERSFLANGDDARLGVEGVGVVLEETHPQLGHRFLFNDTI